jgi:hypothetical protein
VKRSAVVWVTKRSHEFLVRESEKRQMFLEAYLERIIARDIKRVQREEQRKENGQ